MSKLVEHASYIEEDPNDIEGCFFVIRVGVKKLFVEGGYIEKLAIYRGWDENGSPCEYLRVGVAGEALDDSIALTKKEAEEVAQAGVHQAVETFKSMVLPTPTPEPQP